MLRTTQWNESVLLTQAHFEPKKDWLVNGACIMDDTQVFIWDSLTFPMDMATLSSQINRMEINIIYSHADWDHCWGTNGIRYNHVIASTKANQRFEDELPHALKKRFRGKSRALWRTIELVAPTILFEEKIIFRLNTCTIELHSLPGHTKDSIVAWVPQFGLLLAGDSVEEIPVINDPTDVPLWIKLLEEWGKNPHVQHVYPGHGGMTNATILLENQRYLQALTDGINPNPPVSSDFYKKTHAENCKLMGVSCD